MLVAPEDSSNIGTPQEISRKDFTVTMTLTEERATNQPTVW